MPDHPTPVPPRSELRPCPFCGEPPATRKDHGYDSNRELVICSSNHCAARGGYVEPERWNRRAALPAPSPVGGAPGEPVAWLFESRGRGVRATYYSAAEADHARRILTPNEWTETPLYATPVPSATKGGEE